MSLSYVEDERCCGAYRRITAEEAKQLAAEGAAVSWDEGCGYIVYDEQALAEFQAALKRVQ